MWSDPLPPQALVSRVASKGARQRALPEEQEGIARACSPGLLTRHTAARLLRIGIECGRLAPVCCKCTTPRTLELSLVNRASIGNDAPQKNCRVQGRSPRAPYRESPSWGKLNIIPKKRGIR